MPVTALRNVVVRCCSVAVSSDWTRYCEQHHTHCTLPSESLRTQHQI